MSAEKNTGSESAAQRSVTSETVRIEAFDPDDVRPWAYHNRTDTGMDDASLDELANSIRRDGQQQLGLARRLPPGDTHLVEAIYGIRRLEACRRAETLWRAEVRAGSLPDAQCAALMHSENEWSEGVSPLENAVQWKAMLDSGVFKNQSALANALGLSSGQGLARSARRDRAVGRAVDQSPRAPGHASIHRPLGRPPGRSVGRRGTASHGSRPRQGDCDRCALREPDLRRVVRRA